MKKRKIYLKKQLRAIAKMALAAVIFAGLVLIAYELVFWGRIFPGITVPGAYLGGKSEKEAQEAIAKLAPPEILVLTSQDKKFILETKNIELSYDSEATAHHALGKGRNETAPELVKTRVKSLVEKIEIPLAYNYDSESLDQFIARVSEDLFIPSIEPEIKIEDKEVVVEPGKTGQEVDKDLLLVKLQDALGKRQKGIEIPVNVTAARLTSEQVEELKKRAENFIGAKIKFSLEDRNEELKDKGLVKFLAPDATFKEEKITELVKTLADKFSRPVQEPAFKFEGGKVLEFKPAKDGLKVEEEKLKELIGSSLITIEETQELQQITIPATRTAPKIQTAQVNNLGIKELVGKGTSHFRGSISSRIHNITVAASRLNGILIAPGETLSFNRALGDVSQFTGYQQAYIIKDGKTILGDGGGVCQVSSTLFRAALASGLPITERRAHSYRVSYYEQDSGPGFDATVYDPTTDLKIKNDTPGYILIQASVDKKSLTLTFELYGTTDGRVATTTKPRVWDQAEPPPDLYQDDPSLPAGKIKQIDFKAWGAKASFEYRVKRGEEILQDRTFYSAFRPWQAVFLHGTGQ